MYYCIKLQQIGKIIFQRKIPPYCLKVVLKIALFSTAKKLHTLEVDSKFSPAIFADVFLYAALAFATNEYNFI